VVAVERENQIQSSTGGSRKYSTSKRFWQVLLTLGLILCDVLAVNVAFGGVYLVNIEQIEAAGLLIPDDSLAVLLFIVLGNIAFMVAFVASGLYNLRRAASRVDEAYKVFTAISLSTVLCFVINTILVQVGSEIVPWTASVLALGWLIAILSTITLRSAHRSFVFWLRSFGIDTRRVIIVGTCNAALTVWRTIRRTPELGYHVQGFVSDAHPVATIIEGLPVLGRTDQMTRVVRATQAEEILVALSQRSADDLIDIVTQAEDESVSIKVYPDTFQLITNNEVSIGDLNGLPLVSLKNAALDNRWNRMLKRVLDLVVASIILVCASPLILFIALLIKLGSPGPVFFLQERVGLDGKPFFMIKFRTMRTDAEAQGPGWTVANDPRVTRVGRFLRRYSLDEVPQFINVLTGEMSIVGPRPEQPKWVERFRQEIPRYMRRHREKAGITGWAQINGLRGDTSIEERTRYDLYYIENWSLLFDIKIILRTAVDTLTGNQENAY
jgi:Undecaprenyl-phosphate glucose phosphotransferase